jgi:hypothetical protein
MDVQKLDCKQFRADFVRSDSGMNKSYVLLLKIVYRLARAMKLMDAQKLECKLS